AVAPRNDAIDRLCRNDETTLPTTVVDGVQSTREMNDRLSVSRSLGTLLLERGMPIRPSTPSRRVTESCATPTRSSTNGLLVTSDCRSLLLRPPWTATL